MDLGLRTKFPRSSKLQMTNCAPSSTMTWCVPIEQERLTPEHPVLRGTAQNPDVYFQARETVNPYYDATPGIVQAMMDEFAKVTGRHYNLFDYVGHPEAERVVIIMGSGADTAEATVNYLVEQGEKVGVLKVRLYRPFSLDYFTKALPASVKKHCRSRPHQGTRRHGRAALSGYRQCPSRRR